MTAEVNVFLDTSALFAGIWSSIGGPRMILKLGEAGAVNIMVCSRVLNEIESVIRKKAPENIGYLALILERSRTSVAPNPSEDMLGRCDQLLPHKADADIIASAWEFQTDYFVTLDREHFIDNSSLAQEIPFPIGTPGDFLAWFRGRFSNQQSN
jgi:predicted nucleic acid-binding protein